VAKLSSQRLGWKRRVRSSVLHIFALSQYTLHLNVHLNLPDSTTNMPFLGRPESVDRFSKPNTRSHVLREMAKSPGWAHQNES
jgi:hypothetical protein